MPYIYQPILQLRWKPFPTKASKFHRDLSDVQNQNFIENPLQLTHLGFESNQSSGDLDCILPDPMAWCCGLCARSKKLAQKRQLALVHFGRICHSRWWQSDSTVDRWGFLWLQCFYVVGSLLVPSWVHLSKGNMSSTTCAVNRLCKLHTITEFFFLSIVHNVNTSRGLINCAPTTILWHALAGQTALWMIPEVGWSGYHCRLTSKEWAFMGFWDFISGGYPRCFNFKVDQD